MKLFLLLNVFASLVWAQEAVNIADLLEKRTLNDGSFSKATASAQSLNTAKSKVRRIQEVNAQIAAEVNAVSKAFSASSGSSVPSAVRRAASKFDSSLSSAPGNIKFLGTNPTAGQGRVLYVIDKSKVGSKNASKDLMNILTSYKRTAKENDHVWEYSDAFNLTMGSPRGGEGYSAGAMSLGEEYTLKKCRKLLGWRCITSIYRADEFANGNEKAYVLFISLYSLVNNQDNSAFGDDKRAINQITGSTAIYIIKESKDWILLYGTDHQYLNDKQSFSGAIEKEFTKDSERFKQRIASGLGISDSYVK